MQIERERGIGPVITAFSGGGYKVEAGNFLGVYRALLIWPDGTEEWSPPPLDALTVEALGPLPALAPRPEFLLLGTGATMQRPPPLSCARAKRSASASRRWTAAPPRAPGRCCAVRRAGSWVRCIPFEADRHGAILALEMVGGNVS